MARSTLDSKGRVTVPAEIRMALHAEAGTVLEWHLVHNGTVTVRAKNRSVLGLAGALKADKPVGIKDMNPWRDRKGARRRAK